MRGERARKERERREMDKSIEKEGKRSQKQWSLAGRTQAPRKTPMHTHTHNAPQQAQHIVLIEHCN